MTKDYIESNCKTITKNLLNKFVKNIPVFSPLLKRYVANAAKEVKSSEGDAY